MLETIGMIMIVRIRIAANTFEPTVGSVLKIGRKPSVPWSAGPSVCVMKGPSTRIPHRPSTTLGTAASSSTRGPPTAPIPRGASSVRNSAIAIEIGPAIRSAPNEVTIVPKMNDAAPKTLWFGSQAVVVRKPSPNGASPARRRSAPRA